MIAEVRDLETWNEEIYEKFVSENVLVYNRATYDGQMERVALFQCAERAENLNGTLDYCRTIRREKHTRVEEIFRLIPQRVALPGRQHFKALKVTCFCYFFLMK